MAKEDAQSEETKQDDAEALNAAIEEGDEETKDEISEEALKVQSDFDKQMDSDEDDSAVDDGDEKVAKGGDDNAKGDDEPAKKDADDEPAKEKPGEEEAGEETAGEKELRETADAIEKEAEAEAGKTDAQKQAEAEVAKAAEAKAEEAKKEGEDKPYDCGLDPEEFDEDYIKALNTMGQSFQDDKKAMVAENAELRSFVSAQANQRSGDWLDRKIEALGEDFVEVLGEGEFEDLTPGSEQSEARIKLGRRMHLIQLSHQKLEKTVPSRNKLFDQAVSYEFKKQKNKSKTEAETKEKLKDRHGQTLGSGSQRASAQSAADKSLKIQKDFDALLDKDD